MWIKIDSNQVYAQSKLENMTQRTHIFKPLYARIIGFNNNNP